MTLLRPSQRTVTIANGGTTSAAIPVQRRMVLGLRTPATLTSSAMTFLGSEAFDGTFAAIYDSDGTQISVAVAASRSIGLHGSEADAVSAWPFIKLVFGSAEGGARDIVVVMK